jgi:hypothetical protein
LDQRIDQGSDAIPWDGHAGQLGERGHEVRLLDAVIEGQQSAWLKQNGGKLGPILRS